MINNNKDECGRLRTLLVHNPEEFKNVCIIERKEIEINKYT